ncbi:IclR family transcriptional regulator [Paucimonas lemoignei]|uniref:IclR family transcriptional regulator n=1 Tax=Paucimonas lemoignei TaxID=29443 RepID=A0A4R3HW53_PAULE|nr:IclR family transcriptional regulator [Paucimonas lemoignei]TCS37372.1 IclR family transcriptional regulator [Paucimonas lemoignei]
MTVINDKHPPLERYFRILEVLSGFPEGLTLSELTSILALPKATMHRLLAAMQKSNLVTVNAGAAAYLLADRVRRLALLSAGADFIKAMTSSHLQQLVAETGETCYIARLEGNRVRTIVMESPNAPWRGFVLPGKIMYPHATASAKAILAFQSKDVIEQALSGDLPQLTQYTKTNRKDIKAEFSRIRENGFATCIREVDEGLAAVAVPIEVGVAGVIYGLGIVGPLPRITSLIDADIVSRLKTISAAISAFLSKTGAEIPQID